MPGDILSRALEEARHCQLCAPHLPHSPRPIVQLKRDVKLLIIGQAPGRRAHDSVLPWNDASGDRLRSWLKIERAPFYMDPRIGIMPMGFCFPGTNPKGGDFPPRPECAPAWHPRLMGLLPDLQLTLLVGSYAQRFYLGQAAAEGMTETVKNWRRYTQAFFPLPHPSWRNTSWLRRHPWFEKEVVAVLQKRLALLLPDLYPTL